MENCITKINSTEIVFSVKDGNTLIPIRPICKILGIDHSAQVSRLKNDERFKSVVVLSTTTGADGKSYDMVALPIPYALLWLGNINPANVSEDARPAVLRYSVECAIALYNHFAGISRRRQEENAAEIALLESIAELTEKSSVIKAELKGKKDMLAKLRAERLNPIPSLPLE